MSNFVDNIQIYLKTFRTQSHSTKKYEKKSHNSNFKNSTNIPNQKHPPKRKELQRATNKICVRKILQDRASGTAHAHRKSSYKTSPNGKTPPRKLWLDLELTVSLTFVTLTEVRAGESFNFRRMF